MAIKKSDAVKFVYVNGNSLPSKVDDATIYIIGGTQELYVGNLKIAASIDVDSALSTTSTNPVENQAITKELNKKATIESPTFTGIPNASTAAAGTSTTQIATTAFVQNAVTAATIVVDDALNATSTNPVQNKVIKAALDAKAALASPTFTGTPKAPTAAAGTNTTQIATTAFVKTAVDNSAVTVDSSLSDSSTNPVQNKIIKAAIDSKPNTSDIPVATTTIPKANGTAAVGSETKWAKGDHVHPSDTTKANLASPTFTGTPKAPTASKGTSTTQLATTAYVQNELVDYIKDNSSAPIAYGTCDTAADVNEKIITLSSDNPDWELEVGSLIAIRFTAKNTATSPTFNVNGTGAKPIGYNTSDSNNGWAAGEANVTSLYVYNGTCYMWLSHSVDNNTTYTNAALGQGYATSTPPISGVAVTAALSSYALTVGGVVAVKFNTNPVPASATLSINSKGAKAIYYRGAAISANTILAGDTATFIYNGSQYHLVAIDRWGQIATTSSDGLMSASDKTKLDGIYIFVDDDILKTGYSHNSIYRGDSLGTSVSSSQWTSIHNGTFDDMYIGDYWTINSHKYVIAKFYYCSPYNTSFCPSVLMLDFSQSAQKMNDTSTTTGGYAGSKMRTFMDETVTPQLNTDFGSSHVYEPLWFVDNAVTNEIVTGRTSIKAKACLLSEVDVWGYRRASAYAHQYSSYLRDTYNGVGHPIPLISLTGSYTPHGGIGWLRDVCSASDFARANAFNRLHSGAVDGVIATREEPVRPAFFIYQYTI